MSGLRDKLFRHACLFRDAIDATVFSDDTPNMQDFPIECCHHASKLLGLYFFDQHFGLPTIFSGNHPTDSRAQHHWLLLNRFIVDITADQFDQADVIVTLNSAWHEQRNGAPLRGAEFDEVFWNAIRDRRYLGPIYPRILENIPERPRSRLI